MKKYIFAVALCISVVFSSAIGFTYPALNTPQAVLDLVRKEKKDIVILNFFASYCSACKLEVPILSKLQKERKNLKIYGIALDETKPPLEKFITDTKLDYPVYTIPYEVGMAFELDAIPQILIYKNGKLEQKIIGAMPYTTLNNILEKL